MSISKKVKKRKELIMYFLFGVLTTLCNYVVFFFFFKIIKVDYIVSNILAWFFSVLFAFYTNRAFVFTTKSKGLAILKEGLLFFLSRIFSCIVETFLLWFFVDIVKYEIEFVKVLIQIIVVVLNYILSKFMVFKITKC